MNRKIFLASTLSGVLSAAVAVAGGVPGGKSASSGDKVSTDAYVLDSSGKLVRDSANQCVRTSAWKPALALPQCDNVTAAKPVKTTKPSVAAIGKRKPKSGDDSQYVTVSLQAGALFDVNKSTIKSRGKEKLNILARKLKETVTTEKIEIAGHTDSSGSDTYNQKLSERRAAAVKQYLVSQGVAANKMKTVGYGESKPIADNKTATGKARNRRVEVRIIATKQIK